VPRHLVLAICLLAAAVRIAAFVAFDRFRHPEVWEGETVATNLVEGRGFTYTTLGTVYRSYMEPLYPGLCALVYRLTNHRYWVLGLVQVLLGTGLVWLVMVCAHHLGPPGVAIIAGALTALDPALILYTTKFHPFVLDAALWFASFAAVLAFTPDRPWRSIVLAGGVIGLSVLTRPTILACLPVMCWLIWTRSNDRLLLRAVRCAVLALCIGVVVAPWVWRNYQVHHRLMLTRSGTSFVFWLGNNPYIFTGSAMTPDGGEIINQVPESVRADLARRDELGQQDYFRDEAHRFVFAQPGEFVRRWIVKFAYFWWFSPQAGLLYPAAAFRLFQVFSAALLGFAAPGVWISWRDAAGDPMRRGAIVFAVGCCLSIAAAQSLYYVEGRHRLMVEPFLLMFASVSLWTLAKRVRLA
jgi:hypothetical protein